MTYYYLSLCGNDPKSFLSLRFLVIINKANLFNTVNITVWWVLPQLSATT